MKSEGMLNFLLLETLPQNITIKTKYQNWIELITFHHHLVYWAIFFYLRLCLILAYQVNLQAILKCPEGLDCSHSLLDGACVSRYMRVLDEKDMPVRILLHD